MRRGARDARSERDAIHGWRVRIRIDGMPWRIIYRLDGARRESVVTRVARRDEGTYRGVAG